MSIDLYRHSCGCIGGARRDDGHVFVVESCDGDLVLGDVEDVGSGESRPARAEEVREVVQRLRHAVDDSNKLRALEDTLRAALGYR
jgi:hypothetical protein